MKLTPYFEIDKKRYEIKPTRYLFLQYDKLTSENKSETQEQVKATKSLMLMENVKKYANKLKELEEKYFETFDELDEKKYLKVKELYEKAFEELAKYEAENGTLAMAEKKAVDIFEKIAIIGIAEQYYDNDLEKGQKTWEKYVDIIGKTKAIEWLNAMADCLFGEDKDEDENSFLSKMREQKTKQLTRN